MDRRNSDRNHILNTHFPGLIQRVFEIFSWEIGISILFSSLFYFSILPQNDLEITIVATICLSISLYRTYICADDFRHTFKRKKVYFKVNIAAWSIFTLFNLIMALWNKEPAYTLLFFHYKLLNIYTQSKPFVISKVISAAIMSLPMLMCIVLVWLVKSRKSKKHRKRIK